MSERVYQVKLRVKEEYLDELLDWLVPHMDEMLKLSYFYKKELIFQKDLSEAFRILQARYFYKTPEDIENYFQNDANKMRKTLPGPLRTKIELERFLIEEKKL